MSDRCIGHLRDDPEPPTVESLQHAVAWRDAALAACQRERDAALALLADERTAAAREALLELRRADDVIAMLSPSPNHDECELSIRRTAMNNIAAALGADDAR